MGFAESVVGQAALEVRYDDGLVYLDRCGSLTVRVRKELGLPFVGGLPGVEYAELHNPTEHIVFRYGVKNFTGAQRWSDPPTRLELLAPRVWEHVEQALQVGELVTRCGMRIFILWAVPTVAEAEERLSKTGLVSETAAWTTAFGKPKSRVFSGVIKATSNLDVRVGLSVFEQKPDGEIPAEKRAFAPEVAILLDIDGHYMPDKGDHIKLTRAGLKDFMRATWEKAQEFRKVFDKVLGSTEVTHVG